MNFHEGLLLVTWKFSLSFRPCFEVYLLKLEICGRLILDFYYINTSEAPDELSQVNMVSSQWKWHVISNVKITIFSLWKEHHSYGYIISFNKKCLDVSLHDQNIVFSFSGTFGYLRKYSQSSEIFESFGTFVWLQTKFGEKWSEIFGKSSSWACWYNMLARQISS